MDNAQKAIMIGVGLFITIIIISAVLLITNIGTNMINSSRDELLGITESLQNQVLSSFDAQVVTGADVIAACNQYEDTGLSIVVSHYMATGSAKTQKKLGTRNIDTANLTPKFEIASMQQPGGYLYSGNYGNAANIVKAVTLHLPLDEGGAAVTPNKQYRSAIVKDSGTGTLIGIIFSEI